MAKRKVLLINNDLTLSKSLCEQLQVNEEFAPSTVITATEALKVIENEYFHAIFLDTRLQDMDGKTACRQLRQAGTEVPIIIFGSTDCDAEAFIDPEVGANDYFKKPFRFRDVLVSLRLQLARHEKNKVGLLTIGPFNFFPGAKTLVNELMGQQVYLTEKETAILKFLYNAKGEVVSRDTLLVEVWGYNTEVTTHTLETHVYRLRQKIESNPSDAQILTTGPGGYRLVP